MTNESEVWEPSDAWLISLILKLRGSSRDTVVPSAVLASWRAMFRQEVYRVRWARREGRDPYPPRRGVRDPGKITTSEIVLDMLTSPEGRFWVSVAIAMPAMIASWREEERVRLQVDAWQAQARHARAERREIGALRRYLECKVGDAEYVAPEQWSISPYVIAAANGCTSSRVRVWSARLDDRDDAPDVLGEMHEVGAEAHVAVRHLDLTQPEPGEPRGVWPDPPPPPLPEDVPSVSASVAAGERPAFIPGR